MLHLARQCEDIFGAMIRVLALHINDDESHIMCIIRRKAKCFFAAINFGVARVSPGWKRKGGKGGGEWGRIPLSLHPIMES